MLLNQRSLELPDEPVGEALHHAAYLLAPCELLVDHPKDAGDEQHQRAPYDRDRFPCSRLRRRGQPGVAARDRLAACGFDRRQRFRLGHPCRRERGARLTPVDDAGAPAGESEMVAVLRDASGGRWVQDLKPRRLRVPGIAGEAPRRGGHRLVGADGDARRPTPCERVVSVAEEDENSDEPTPAWVSGRCHGPHPFVADPSRFDAPDGHRPVKSNDVQPPRPNNAASLDFFVRERPALYSKLPSPRGHASIQTTLNIFTHVVDASHRTAIEAVERKLFPSVPKSADQLAEAVPVSDSVN